MPANTNSQTLDRAFRAAHLLTGRTDLAENAVLDGIAMLESNDTVETALVAKTIQSVIRRRTNFPNQLERALAFLPPELQRLTLLEPVARDGYIFRILFGLSPADCAMILNLTIQEFEQSLLAAFQQLSMFAPPICSPAQVPQAAGAHR